MTDVLANDAVRIALLLLLFVAIVAIVYAVGSFVGERQAIQDRLSGNATSTVDPAAPIGGLRVHDARGAWVALVTAIEKAGIPLVDTKDSTIRSKLVAAGYKQDYAPRVYSLVRLTLVIGLPLGILHGRRRSGWPPGTASSCRPAVRGSRRSADRGRRACADPLHGQRDQPRRGRMRRRGRA